MGAAGDRTIYADKKADDLLLGVLLGSGGVWVLPEEGG